MRCIALVIFMVLLASSAAAQEPRQGFAGVLVGVSTLSADGRSVITPSEAAVSLYKPENGLAVDAFAGYHLSRFFSVQANYIWNRNALTLVSSSVTPAGGAFYEQQRESSQHVFVADTLVYFRRLGSGIRPYLGTGLAVVSFSSREADWSLTSGLVPPEGSIRATRIALRSHVGIDFAISDRIVARYSFSDTISGNPISPYLTPRGKRGLANYQNLFGVIALF
jgi:opacity protein-like surface antigen